MSMILFRYYTTHRDMHRVTVLSLAQSTIDPVTALDGQNMGQKAFKTQLCASYGSELACFAVLEVILLPSQFI